MSFTITDMFSRRVAIAQPSPAPKQSKGASAAPPLSHDRYVPSRNQTIYRDVSNGYAVQQTTDDLQVWRANDMSETEPTFSLAKRFNDVCKNPVEGNFMCSGSRLERTQLTAVAGPYLSMLTTEGGYVPGAAHDWANTTFETIDMRTNQRVKLTDLFPEKDIFNALMRDPVVVKTLAGAKPGNLGELLRTLDGKGDPDGMYIFDTDLLKHFTFHHVNGDKVAVRIAVPYGVEAARGTLTQLGIELPITPALKTAIARAAAKDDGTGYKQGLLWAEAETRLAGKQTEIVDER